MANKAGIFEVDPISRIEGHLGIKITSDATGVTEANAHGNLWRGFENFLLGRDVNDAITFVQRICGVCPVPHGLTSTYACDTVLGYSAGHITFATAGSLGVPKKAVSIRNLVLGAEFLMSSITHFYHLAAPSYIQGPSIPPWTPYFADSYYSNGVGPTSDMLSHGRAIPQLDGDGFSHDLWSTVIRSYVVALRVRRLTFEAGALFAGRMPMTSVYIGGGVMYDGTEDLTPRVNQFKSLMQEVGHFVIQEYVPIALALSLLYPKYDNVNNVLATGTGLGYGAGIGRYLSWGAFPNPDTDALALPGGLKEVSPVSGTTPGFTVANKADVATYFLAASGTGSVKANLKEDIKYSRYGIDSRDSGVYTGTIAYPGDVSRTKPNRSAAGAYTYMKAPRWNGQACEVGPMARMFVAGFFQDNVALASSLGAYYTQYVKAGGNLFTAGDTINSVTYTGFGGFAVSPSATAGKYMVVVNGTKVDRATLGGLIAAAIASPTPANAAAVLAAFDTIVFETSNPASRASYVYKGLADLGTKLAAAGVQPNTGDFLYDGTQYVAYVVNVLGGGLVKATSPDMLTWTAGANLGKPTSGVSVAAVTTPSVVVDGTTLRVWFTDPNDATSQLKYASYNTVTSTWSAATLVTVGGTAPAAFAGHPFAIKGGTTAAPTYTLYYVQGSGGVKRAVGSAPDVLGAAQSLYDSASAAEGNVAAGPWGFAFTSYPFPDDGLGYAFSDVKLPNPTGLDPAMIAPDLAVALVKAGLATLNCSAGAVTAAVINSLPAATANATIVSLYTEPTATITGIITSHVLGLKAGKSIMDRLRGRAVESLYLIQNILGTYAKPFAFGGADSWAGGWVAQLLSETGGTNDGVGSTWTPKNIPAGTVQGWGGTEAPRGALMHQVTITAGKITKYQCIVPTTWNGSPKDTAGSRGAIEQACIGVPFADAPKTITSQDGATPVVAAGGVEVLRVAQSFDPCIACAIH